MPDRAEIGQEIQIKRDAFEILMELSNLLDTGLDEETLSCCVRLCENGVNPECLANVVKELRREIVALNHAEAENV